MRFFESSTIPGHFTLRTMRVSLVGVAVLLCIVELSGHCAGLEIEPIVTVKEGQVRGKISTSRLGRKYVQFVGVPYAGKPRRFQPAGPAVAWTGVRDGREFGPKCMQWDSELKDVVGDEDCLTVNVYTPVYSSPKQTRIPVMVFIHGGSFMKGSGSDYGPDYFMDEDVILVTFNYRLGTFGFLTTLNKNLIPNLGMKDQVAALCWIKENIQSFGGDDGRITIFGSSAGAAAVSYHILSPLSKGLFHSAISQSGNALCPWALVRNPTEIAIELGKLLNCSTANSFTIAACLKVTEAREIITQQQELTGWNPQAVSFVPFGPVIELVHHAVDTGPMFLPDSPKNMLRDGRFHKVPWLMGVNSADGITLSSALLLNSTRLMQQVNRHWLKIAPLAFAFKDTAPNPAIVAKKIRDYYFGGVGISAETKVNLTHALSDGNFFRCTKNCALVYAAQQNPVWVYYFTHQSKASILSSLGFPQDLGYQGVPHNDELQYLFKMVVFPEINSTSPDFQFSRNLIKLWTSFATEGRPTSLWNRALDWQPLQPGHQIRPGVSIKMYKLDRETAVIDEPFLERLGFWDKLRLFPPQAAVAGVIDGSENPSRESSSTSSSTGTGSAQKELGWSAYLMHTLFVCLQISMRNL